MKESITLEWLGAAGFRFAYNGTVILLDPYLTRVKNRETPIVSDPAYLAKYIDRADYIVASHSHYDHFADTPALAKMTNALVIGSPTSLNVCRAHGISEDKLHLAAPKLPCVFPEFSVTFLPSQHGLNATGEVPFPGRFDTPPEPLPRLAPEFVEGGAYAPLFQFGDTKVLHIGSANIIEKEISNVRVDVLLVCIAWRERVPQFLAKLLECTHPTLIIPMHYDDYWTPLEQGLVMRSDTSLTAFCQEVKAIYPQGKVLPVGFFEKVNIAEARVV